MNTTTRVVFNTTILYLKVIASMAIALISVPLVLNALGASDYGLYNLVAGVVSMLSFLNNSMTVSSQRFMSVAIGANDNERINIIYNTSFFLHLTLGVVVVLLLELGSFFISELNIETDKLVVAHIVYQFLIFTTFCRIISVPFDSIMNAHEDMLAFSIIEIIESVIMLVIALTLKRINIEKLIYYSLCVFLISVLSLLLKYLWSHIKYSSYRIDLHKFKHKLESKDMFGFAGWNLFGGLAMVGRNQGVAVIINLFLGTVVNAAYGIANQVNGALCSFSSTFQRAINPQLMKSEGMGDRDRLIRISFVSSKYSVLAISLFAIPLIVEIKDVFQIWLGSNIPQFTIELSVCIIILSLITQYSIGIMSAIQACGNIKYYQIVMGCILLLNIPFAYVILKNGYPVYYVTISYIALELISLFIRLYMAKTLISMPTFEYLKKVVFPTLAVICVSSIICLLPHLIIKTLWSRLILTCLVYACSYLCLMWLIAIDQPQKEYLLKLIRLK